MKTSTRRILTTHVGSLIRPPALQDIMRAKQAGQPYDAAAYEACLKDSTAEIVRRERRSDGSTEETVVAARASPLNPICPDADHMLMIEAGRVRFDCRYSGSEGTTANPF